MGNWLLGFPEGIFYTKAAKDAKGDLEDKSRKQKAESRNAET